MDTATLSSEPVPYDGLGQSLVIKVPKMGLIVLGPASIVDVADRRIARVASGSFTADGHRARWDGLDPGGRAVSPGLHFIRLTTAEGIATRRLPVVR